MYCLLVSTFIIQPPCRPITDTDS